MALGYAQIAGVDHQDNFAPVIHETTFRLVMVLMLLKDWVAEIVDVETAFLCGELEEEIFMKVPEGINLVTGTTFGDDDALKLEHSIYGLVHAARQFFLKNSEYTRNENGVQEMSLRSMLTNERK